MRPLDDHSSSQLSPRPRVTTRALRATVAASTALCSLVLAPAVMATAAASSGGTIGTFKVTGQVAGTLKVPQEGKGTLGVPAYGCQVGVVSTQVLINFFNVKLPLNGHTKVETAVEGNVNVESDGKTESLAPINKTDFVNTVSFQLTAGTKTYNWSSISGTVSLKAKGNDGSFSANLVPSGSPRVSSDPLASGSATKPVHFTGSWSSCHAFAH